MEHDRAVFSPDNAYRYFLTREFQPGLFTGVRKPILFCGYNPSTATASKNDPTIRREIDFAISLHGTVLFKVNLFGFISPKPGTGDKMRDPVGPDNDDSILKAIIETQSYGGVCIAAWGIPKGGPRLKSRFHERQLAVRHLADWKALKLTQDGYPQHPLYLPKGSELVDWAIPI